MNRNSRLLLLLLSGLLILALIFKNGHLVLLAIPFLVYLFMGLIQAPAEMDIHVLRQMEKPSMVAGEKVEIRILVRNQGDAVRNLYLDDGLFPGTKLVDGQPNRMMSLVPGKSAEYRYSITAKRGIYSWQRIQAISSDPLGLFEVKENISAPGKLMVRPVPMPIRPFQLRPRSTLPTSGLIPARKAGLGTDFWGVREYREGDSLRRINWQWTAKHRQKMFTNEFEREEIADYGLILDTRRLTSEIETEAEIFERSVSAAAALSSNFLQNGNRVSLLVFGKGIRTAFPGYGKAQRNILLRHLAAAKVGGDLPFSSIGYFPTQLFPTRSLLVIFSLYQARDNVAYAHLRSHGYNILLISPNAIDFAAKKLPKNNVNALAARTAQVERIIELNRLVKLGVNVIDWQVEEPLGILLKDAAKEMKIF